MNSRLRIALISTDYPPLNTSAAVQMRDLAQELAALGHRPMVIVPGSSVDSPWTLDEVEGVEVLRLLSAPTRVETHLKRAIAEMKLPFTMWFNFRKCPAAPIEWDLVIWYSPPIFFAPLIWLISRSRRTRRYLILRDMFPEWALDLGILKRGPVYWFFKFVAALQYLIADAIGVQTSSNLTYLPKWTSSVGRRIEVLNNWLTLRSNIGCSISIAETPLAGRKIFVYIGNMGVAQGVDILIELAEKLQLRRDVGFLFVGRGSEFKELVDKSVACALDNVLFFDEIDSAEIPGLLAQCHVGLVSLQPRHKTHNIPGKFVSYMCYGVPVLARLNMGTDLAHLISDKDVGRVYFGDSSEDLKRLAEELADDEALRSAMSERGRQLGRSIFSPRAAAEQIVRAFLTRSVI